MHQAPSRGNSSPGAGPDPPLGTAQLGQTHFAPSHATIFPKSFPGPRSCWGTVGASTPLRSLLEDGSGRWLWGTAPGCHPTYTGSSPHLFVSRPTGVSREPTSPWKSWQILANAGVMLMSLCLITAVLKAQYLLHYTGRSEQT